MFTSLATHSVYLMFQKCICWILQDVFLKHSPDSPYTLYFLYSKMHFLDLAKYISQIFTRLALHSCHLCRGFEAPRARHPEEAEKEVVRNHDLCNRDQIIKNQTNKKGEGTLKKLKIAIAFFIRKQKQASFSNQDGLWFPPFISSPLDQTKSSTCNAS